MPRNVLFMDRLDSIVVAMFRLVVNGGVSGPSLRAIAAEAGISPAGVINHFGSADRVWGLAAHRWARDRAGARLYPTGAAGVASLLPEDQHGADDLAFDFALSSIGRGHTGIADAMSGLRLAERERLARLLPELGEPDLDLTVAVIEGLRYAISLPEGALPIARARGALQQFLDGKVTSAS